MSDVSDMDLMEKVEFVRSTVTPLDLIDMLGLEEHRNKIRSPWNEADENPSCHLYEDGFFDYSTGRHGDVIDLYRQLAGCSFARAVNRLAEGAQRLDVDEDRIQRKPVELPDLTEQWGALPDCANHSAAAMCEHWAGAIKGISPTHLRLLRSCGEIKMTPTEMYIAHRHFAPIGDGVSYRVVRGIKIRQFGGGKSAVPGSTFACGLYRSDLVNPAGVAVITEGESDCWMLARHWYGGTPAVFALPSGAGLWRDSWLADLEGYETIYTAFDNDRAGEQATEKVRKAVGWGRWRELKVPTLYKDVREAMVAGWEPKLP